MSLCDYPGCNVSDPKMAMTISAKGGPFMKMEPFFDHALCQRHYERLKKVLEKELK